MNDSLTANRSTALAGLHDHFDYQPQPYLKVLRLVYQYGYVTAQQLRWIDPTIKTAARYLAELKRLGLVDTKPRVMRHEHLIYYLPSRGQSYLKTRKNRFPVASHRHETIQPWQLRHELAVTDVMALVTAWVARQPVLTIEQLDRRLFQRPMLVTTQENGERKRKRVVDDFQTLLLGRRGPLTFPFQFYFEIEMGTHDMRTVRAKVENHQRWYEQGGRGELATLFREHSNLNRPIPTYRLCFVVQNRRGNDLRALARYATHIRRVNPRPQVVLATLESVTKALHEETYAIWYPVDLLRDPNGASERVKYDDMEAQLRQTKPAVLLPRKVDKRTPAVAG